MCRSSKYTYSVNDNDDIYTSTVAHDIITLKRKSLVVPFVCYYTSDIDQQAGTVPILVAGMTGAWILIIAKHRSINVSMRLWRTD